MRVLIAGVVAFVGLGALVAVRVSGAVGQLEALGAVQREPRSAKVEAASEAHDGERRALAMPPASAEATPPAPVPAPTTGGDEHILRMLASDPEFARAADELLADPDPDTQREARQLLRDLGVQAPEHEGR
jgi:hypothetical protein